MALQTVHPRFKSGRLQFHIRMMAARAARATSNVPLLSPLRTGTVRTLTATDGNSWSVDPHGLQFRVDSRRELRVVFHSPVDGGDGTLSERHAEHLESGCVPPLWSIRDGREA